MRSSSITLAVVKVAVLGRQIAQPMAQVIAATDPRKVDHEIRGVNDDMRVRRFWGGGRVMRVDPQPRAIRPGRRDQDLRRVTKTSDVAVAELFIPVVAGQGRPVRFGGEIRWPGCGNHVSPARHRYAPAQSPERLEDLALQTVRPACGSS